MSCHKRGTFVKMSIFGVAFVVGLLCLWMYSKTPRNQIRKLAHQHFSTVKVKDCNDQYLILEIGDSYRPEETSKKIMYFFEQLVNINLESEMVVLNFVDVETNRSIQGISISKALLKATNWRDSVEAKMSLGYMVYEN